MSKELMAVESAKVTDAELTMHLENLGLLKDLSVGEKNSYLQIAKAFNLNPFKREIHVSKYGGQMSIITGYEVYIKRAERTGQLDGWSVQTTGSVESKDLKAIVTIHRKDRTHPFIWEALYNEYVQLKDGKPNKFWQKAHTMIKKVAISQGFRLCFSDELGGMPYTSDELDIITEDVQAVVTTEPAKSKKKPAEPFSLSEAAAQELQDLINNSTLDANGRVSAANSITNATSQVEIDKIKARLLQLQTN